MTLYSGHNPTVQSLAQVQSEIPYILVALEPMVTAEQVRVRIAGQPANRC